MTDTKHHETLPELIETLWNVNKILRISRDNTRMGINRNIVECK